MVWEFLHIDMKYSEMDREDFMKSFFAEYDSKLYEKPALLKAAYAFVDKYYIHLEFNADGDYYIRFTPKSGETSGDVIEQFENELLAQTVRQHVYKETKTLREIMVARAMASSMILDDVSIDAALSGDGKNKNYVLDDILTDWFKHGNE